MFADLYLKIALLLCSFLPFQFQVLWGRKSYDFYHPIIHFRSENGALTLSAMNITKKVSNSCSTLHYICFYSSFTSIKYLFWTAGAFGSPAKLSVTGVLLSYCINSFSIIILPVPLKLVGSGSRPTLCQGLGRVR
jgi:hypothetical protein